MLTFCMAVGAGWLRPGEEVSISLHFEDRRVLTTILIRASVAIMPPNDRYHMLHLYPRNLANLPAHGLAVGLDARSLVANHVASSWGALNGILPTVPLVGTEPSPVAGTVFLAGAADEGFDAGAEMATGRG